MSRLLDLFSSTDLTPHGFCLLWRPALLWLQIVPDALIGLSYYSIPLALAYFVCKRRDIAFSWIFWMFAAFILACGTTHFFEIWTLWHPDYAAQGLIKAVTAEISVATAIVMWPVLPRLLALPSLRQVNDALSVEIKERNRAVEALQRKIVEHQVTEEALRQSQKMEGLGQLTGGVAHDFNNILLILQGQLYMLRRRGLVAGTEVTVAAMEGAVARGESLARQLLSFARRQTLQPKIIDLHEEMPKLTDLLRQSLRGDIEISLDISPAAGRIEVDPHEFELALINIASNARDAIARGGTVTLSIANETLPGTDPGLEGLAGDFVRIAIGDTGKGIPQEIIGRVFEPFFTSKEAGTGTGLGLAQVYGFAHQSEGTVTAASIPGQGTTITLHLPRSSAPGIPKRQTAADPSIATAHQTILLVEDNPEVAKVGMFLLQEFGYRVALAEDARQALSLVGDGATIDLVFSDIVMPGGFNGVDLARTLRRRFPQLPVLLTTGYSTEADEAAQEGFPIVPKPYHPQQLRQAICDLMRSNPRPPIAVCG